MSRQSEPATKHDLQEVEHKLTTKIDANAAKIDAVDQRLADVEHRLTAKIDANATKIDANRKMIEENGHKIDANADKIDTNTRRLDKLTTEVLKNRELIEQKVSRDEFNKRMDELVTGQDKMMLILTRWDQERVTTNVRLDRVEKGVEKNKGEIRKIKTKLAMP